MQFIAENKFLKACFHCRMTGIAWQCRAMSHDLVLQKLEQNLCTELPV
jgi:hypothetical protein